MNYMGFSKYLQVLQSHNSNALSSNKIRRLNTFNVYMYSN